MLFQHVLGRVTLPRILLFSLLIIFLNSVNYSFAAEYYWESIPLRNASQKGSGLPGGEGFQMVMAIEYSPSNPDVVYMGTDTTAVWKSVDGGRSWQPKYNGFWANGAVSLGIDPVNSDIVYAAGIAGKKKDEWKLQSSRARGIYLSKDGGVSWKFVKQTDFFKKSSKGDLFAFDSQSINENRTMVVYAGTDNAGLLRSGDGGVSWQSIGLKGVVITDLKEIPNRQGELLIATEQGLYELKGEQTQKKVTNLPAEPKTIAICSDTPKIVYAAAGKKGVFKSLDGGTTFFKSSRGLPKGEINDVCVSPVNCNYVYARGHHVARGPYYSHDGGKTWNYPQNTNIGNLVDRDGFWFSSPFAAHPLRENEALHSSNGRDRIIKTIDGGKNWQYSNFGYTGGLMIDVEFISPKSMLFSLTDFGLWFTKDNGATFREVNIPRVFNARSSSAVAVFGDTIVASAGKWRKKALLVTHDKGNSWKTYQDLTGREWFIAIHPQDTNIIYAGPYRSNDGGHSWQTLKHSVRAMFLKDGDIVYSTDEGHGRNSEVLKSTDRGETWRRIGGSLPIPVKSIQDMAIDPIDPNRIYLATRKGVWILNEDLQWGNRDEGNGIEKDFFGKNFVNCIAVDPNNRDIVYLGKRAPASGRSNGIFRSIDRGNSWEEFNHNLAPGVNVWSIHVNPFDSTVLIGTSFGTYRLAKSDKRKQ